LGILAEFRRARGKLDEAETLYRQALSLRQTAFGKDHPNVVLNLEDLADLLLQVGRQSEAMSLIEEAKQARQRIAEAWQAAEEPASGAEDRTPPTSNL